MAPFMPPPPPKPWPFRIEYPPELPISARADEIIAAIRDHQVLVLADGRDDLVHPRTDR